ncbi:MAG: hypothetical protein WC707_00115 [Candidatus Babeliaceae bacterium]|jgi:WD40 repeat protein
MHKNIVACLIIIFFSLQAMEFKTNKQSYSLVESDIKKSGVLQDLLCDYSDKNALSEIDLTDYDDHEIKLLANLLATTSITEEPEESLEEPIESLLKKIYVANKYCIEPCFSQLIAIVAARVMHSPQVVWAYQQCSVLPDIDTAVVATIIQQYRDGIFKPWIEKRICKTSSILYATELYIRGKLLVTADNKSLFFKLNQKNKPLVRINIDNNASSILNKKITGKPQVIMPDNTIISFASSHDMYQYDINTGEEKKLPEDKRAVIEKLSKPTASLEKFISFIPNFARYDFISPCHMVAYKKAHSTTIQLWNLETGDCLKLVGHTSPPMTCTISSDHSKLFSADCTSIRQWNLKEPLDKLSHYSVDRLVKKANKLRYSGLA